MTPLGCPRPAKRCRRKWLIVLPSLFRGESAFSLTGFRQLTRRLRKFKVKGTCLLTNARAWMISDTDENRSATIAFDAQALIDYRASATISI